MRAVVGGLVVGVVAIVAFGVIVGTWLVGQTDDDRPRLSPAEVRPVLDAIERDVRAIPPVPGAELEDVTQADECTGDSLPTVWVSLSYSLPASRPPRTQAILLHYRRALEHQGWRSTQPEVPSPSGVSLDATKGGEHVGVGIEVFTTSDGVTEEHGYAIYGSIDQPVCPNPYD